MVVFYQLVSVADRMPTAPVAGLTTAGKSRLCGTVQTTSPSLRMLQS